MSLRAQRRWSPALLLIGLAMLALLASNAQADPQFIGDTITAPMPTNSDAPPVVVNLRQQQILAGEGPIQLSIERILIDGLPSERDFVSVLGYGDNFGAVCLAIMYPGFPPGESPIQVELIARDRNQAQARAVVEWNPGQGPTIDIENDQQAETCADGSFNMGLPPIAVGQNFFQEDTDGQTGEPAVELNATGSSDPDGQIVSYLWEAAGGISFQTTEAFIFRPLPDGVHNFVLTVIDDLGNRDSTTVTITVQAPPSNPNGPTVDAGPDQTIPDSDGLPGEDVVLSGTATDPLGIQSYEWYSDTETLLGTGSSLTIRLDDGVHFIFLVATNTQGVAASDVVQITIGASERTILSELPGLTPNERRLAAKLDQACANVLGSETPDDEAPLEADREAVVTAKRAPNAADLNDFVQKCRGLVYNKNTSQLVDAMGELLGDDFAVARTQTLLFANTQYASVMDRLIALRGGAKGLSLAGLNLVIDGERIPLAELQSFARTLLGGGASSDSDLWNEKWGLWARGNYSFGSKKQDSSSPRFDADQYALVAGIDYRFSTNAVAGAALAYGNSSVEFEPSNEGGLDTESWALSLYGSVYAARNFYLDGIVNIANSNYEAQRNISYVDGFGLVTADAFGDTDGLTVSAGLSSGYDFLLGGLTVSPTLGVFYIDAQIDDFAETGAGGLNLLYDEQKFKSLTANVGLRATFAWNLSWGVLLPHIRADFVREFEDDVDVFGIRFASDPNAVSTPPILVETENPDTSYWRFAGGFSAQFKYGISGYVEYQRLESFESITFQDVSLGLRFQRAF